MRANFVSSVHPASNPSVGVFWGVPDAGGRTAIIGEATALDDSETYGAFLTFASGHLDVWDAWRGLGPHALSRHGLPTAVAWHEYEDFPRGRVVYRPADRTFIIYADRRLHTLALREEIEVTFHLRGLRTTLRSDPHYTRSPFP